MDIASSPEAEERYYHVYLLQAFGNTFVPYLLFRYKKEALAYLAYQKERDHSPYDTWTMSNLRVEERDLDEVKDRHVFKATDPKDPVLYKLFYTKTYATMSFISQNTTFRRNNTMKTDVDLFVCATMDEFKTHVIALHDEIHNSDNPLHKFKKPEEYCEKCSNAIQNGYTRCLDAILHTIDTPKVKKVSLSSHANKWTDTDWTSTYWNFTTIQLVKVIKLDLKHVYMVETRGPDQDETERPYTFFKDEKTATAHLKAVWTRHHDKKDEPWDETKVTVEDIHLYRGASTLFEDTFDWNNCIYKLVYASQTPAFLFTVMTHSQGGEFGRDSIYVSAYTSIDDLKEEMEGVYEQEHDSDRCDEEQSAPEDYCERCQKAVDNGYTTCLEPLLKQVDLYPVRSLSDHGTTFEAHRQDGPHENWYSWRWDTIDLDRVGEASVSESDTSMYIV